jgi:hypothetical protein
MCDTESGECVPCKPDLSGAIWNTDAGDVWCTTPQRPVKHWPPDQECPVLTEMCEPPLPQPQCQSETDCNCWRGTVQIVCPEPPPVGDCPWGTPTAQAMQAQGKRVEIRPKREGRKGMGATPLGAFGREYYCQDGLWPEACQAGRSFGPVAPDGHPDRVACEKQFLELDCPYFSYRSQEHMSFDPWIALNGVNQNHPRNVAQGCGTQFQDHPSVIKDSNGRPQAGQWSWATAHGNGQVCAEAKNRAGRKCIDYVER